MYVIGRKWRFHSLKKLSVYQALFSSKVSEISTFHLFFVKKGGPSTPGRKKVSLYFLGRIILKIKKTFHFYMKCLHFDFLSLKKVWSSRQEMKVSLFEKVQCLPSAFHLKNVWNLYISPFFRHKRLSVYAR